MGNKLSSNPPSWIMVNIAPAARTNRIIPNHGRISLNAFCIAVQLVCKSAVYLVGIVQP